MVKYYSLVCFYPGVGRRIVLKMSTVKHCRAIALFEFGKSAPCVWKAVLDICRWLSCN